MGRKAIAAIIAIALSALSAEHGVGPADAATINVPCSTADLTAAINTANNETTNPGFDTLELAAGCNYAYTTPASTDTALPNINTSITINGHGATISRDPGAATRFRIIQAGGLGNLTLSELTITGGRAPNGASAGQAGQGGGGILIGSSASVTIIDSTITGNQAGNGNSNGLMGGNGGPGGAGGGIHMSSGSLAILDSTISANSAGNGGAGRAGAPPTGGFGGAGGRGGGIYAAGINIANSTVSGNAAGSGAGGGAGGGNGEHGGGIFFEPALSKTLTNVTIANNSAGGSSGGAPGNGGGVYLDAGATSKNSIVANNTTGGNCSGFSWIAGSINNIASDASCTGGFAFSGSINLGPLASNGGPTLTHALGGGSSAIDAGDNPTCAVAPVNNLDQRGVVRPIDGDAVGVAVCDVGAYEAPPLQPGPQFTVDTTAPHNDGACHLPPGDCTLREAINAANADPAHSGIHLGNVQTYTLTGADNAGNGLPVVSTDIAIIGNGSTIARQASAPAFRIFQVPSGGSLLLENVTVSGGEATGPTGDGGGIFVNGGQLTLVNSRVTGNRAAMGAAGTNGGAGRHGGGIAISGGGAAQIWDSTINGNVAGGGGGGFELNGGSGGSGGGIALLGGTMNIERSVVNSNFAGFGAFSGPSGNGGHGGNGGGLYLAGGSSAQLSNTTIHANTAGSGGPGTTGNGNGGSGGGIHSPSSISTFTNLTITNNNVGAAGGTGAANGTGSGVGAGGAAITVRNTVMSNGAGGNCAFAPQLGSGANIATDASCGASFTQRTPAQINFGTFGNHGGPTFTLPLVSPSAAIDAGDNNICANPPIGNTDQRGFPRPVDGDNNGTATCDVGAYEYCLDSDGDVWCDFFDSCPLWPNPAQTLPAWPVPPEDSDCDGFTDEREAYMTTDPSQQCAANTTANNETGADGWPFDMDDNRRANTIDIGFFVGKLGLDNTETGWTPRLDLSPSANGIINTIDIGLYVARLGDLCSPSGP